MSAKQMHRDIKEINLSCPLLAQVLRMAATNMPLDCFRFDEHLLLNKVTDYNKDRMVSLAHAAISTDCFMN